ncbi:MAG: ribosome silencing factor [Symbiobacteriaceae bacterium]|nr:ribosome silencing factor [Symbiobacteriaceae bacterium]
MYSSKELALAIASWGEERKASEVLILEIGQISIIADYFVIMHASNRTLTMALTDQISDEVEKKFQLHLPHVEGRQEGDWLLLDYGSVVVHIFLEGTRRFYDLERLWIDAPVLHRTKAPN